MARATPLQNNFSSGVFRPELEGRVDIERYASAVRTLEHFIPMTPGGVRRRTGSHFVAEVKDSENRVRLIPFEFSDTQAYVLEFGNGYIRFYMNHGQILDNGGELVTNGTFDAGITGWTDASTGSGDIDWDATDQAMSLSGAGPGNHGVAQQQVTSAATIGASYRFQILARLTCQVSMGTTVGGTDLLPTQIVGGGGDDADLVELTVVATTADIWLEIRKTLGTTIVDDISVQLIGTPPYEIVAPYTTVDLAKIKHVQSADVLYLVHPDYPPHKLTRTGHTDWTLRPISFLPPATDEEPIELAATLTPAATTGLDIVFTASTSVFLAADVDRMIVYGAARATIQTVTSGTVVRVDILDDFPNTDPIPAGDWQLHGSPNGDADPGAKEPVGKTTTVTISPAGWRAADVGKYILLNSGMIKITKFNSSTSVKGEILKVLTTADAAIAGAWTLEVAAWSATRGYPAAISFHEGRLVLGGSYTQPQTIWGSETGDFEEFALGTDPADAYEFGIAANKVNIIRWLLPSRVLVVGTKGGEFRITGGLEQAITPTNVDAKSESAYGSNFVTPVRVGAAVLFVQRSGRKLRELAYSQDLDAYVAPDLTVLAAHLLPIGATIEEMDFQQDPDPVLWVVRSDGVLLSLTYDRANNVVGWANHPPDGEVESVCVIPHPNGDREQVWLAVKRTINEATKRYVEYLDDSSGAYGDLYTDCSLTYSGAPATTFGGLEHLRGKVVDIVGDGAYYGQQTVPTTGTAEVVISPAATAVEIGLPYTSTLETLRLKIPIQSGSSQGRKMRLTKWILRVFNTMGITINGHVQPARRSTMLLGDAPTLFTGDYDGTKLGWKPDNRNLIVQTLPFPATILGIFGTVDVADN